MRSVFRVRNLYVAFTGIIILSSCGIVHKFDINPATQNDFRRFSNNVLVKNQNPFVFYPNTASKSLNLPDSLKEGKESYLFEKGLAESGTLAFLVIKNDTLYYEKYFNNYNADSTISSFSVVKSFVSALVGIAIKEGYIKSTDEPITRYIPELRKPGFEKITIGNLLNMESGISFNEKSINPFGDIGKYYYGKNIRKYIGELRVKEEPGKSFEYESVDVQLLGIILENATKRPLYEYMQEKIWTPLGMEYNASWSTDSKKDNETKAFCCLNAKARDFAKFGRLYLNKGNWNGEQILPEAWVKKSTEFKADKNDFEYNYLWWNNREKQVLTDTTKLTGLYKIIDITTKEKVTEKFVIRPGNDYYAEGLRGQFIYVYPEKDFIIVRLGKKNGSVSWPKVFREIADRN